MIMDQYTTYALWDYWRRGDDEEVIIDDEISNIGEENLMNENEATQIFRIDTDLFHFETPLCKAFKEFNYLSQINFDVLTKDIRGFKTHEEYKDDWIYDWNNGIPWVDEKPCTDDEERTEPIDNIDHECESLRFKSGHAKWPTYSQLKERALINKGILEESINKEEESRKAKQGWFDEHMLTGDDDDDISDLEDYLIRKDTPYYVNEEKEKFKERRCKLLGIP
nr:hypothetical protein [Tanacetum cinerariifolium]